MFDIEAHNRNAILKKKAELAYIESILSRPPVTRIRWGMESKPTPGSRIRLHEKALRLKQAIFEGETGLLLQQYHTSRDPSVRAHIEQELAQRGTPLRKPIELKDSPLLSASHEPQQKASSALMTANPSPQSRTQFVDQILTKKGWSTHDWAVQSNVDFHTADNYRKGFTKPFPSTRKKLADSLGIAVDELPI